MIHSFKTAIRKASACTLAAAILIVSPGLGCYEALAQWNIAAPIGQPGIANPMVVPQGSPTLGPNLGVTGVSGISGIPNLTDFGSISDLSTLKGRIEVQSVLRNSASGAPGAVSSANGRINTDTEKAMARIKVTDCKVMPSPPRGRGSG